MLLNFDNSKPIVLIDGGYYVFYRYFATMRWFVFQKKEFDIDTITENEEFVSSFIKHYDNDIRRICRKWKTVTNNIVFCADCQRSNIWRNDLYQEYKGNRVQNTNFNAKIFNVFNNHIAKNQMKKVEFNRLEADDIVYLIQKQLKNKFKQNIIIISNDNDYLQLANDERIIINNMQFKDITLRGSSNSHHDLIHKAIYGDKSDNIHKIASFITKEKAIELSKMEKPQLDRWIEENDLKEKFAFNMSLVSFENIPKTLAQQFYKTIEISFG
jgi:5'-3' exonuclease